MSTDNDLRYRLALAKAGFNPPAGLSGQGLLKLVLGGGLADLIHGLNSKKETPSMNDRDRHLLAACACTFLTRECKDEQAMEFSPEQLDRVVANTAAMLRAVDAFLERRDAEAEEARRQSFEWKVGLALQRAHAVAMSHSASDGDVSLRSFAIRARLADDDRGHRPYVLRGETTAAHLRQGLEQEGLVVVDCDEILHPLHLSDAERNGLRALLYEVGAGGCRYSAAVSLLRRLVGDE